MAGGIILWPPRLMIYCIQDIPDSTYEASRVCYLRDSSFDQATTIFGDAVIDINCRDRRNIEVPSFPNTYSSSTTPQRGPSTQLCGPNTTQRLQERTRFLPAAFDKNKTSCLISIRTRTEVMLCMAWPIISTTRLTTKRFNVLIMPRPPFSCIFRSFFEYSMVQCQPRSSTLPDFHYEDCYIYRTDCGSDWTTASKHRNKIILISCKTSRQLSRQMEIDSGAIVRNTSHCLLFINPTHPCHL